MSEFKLTDMHTHSNFSPDAKSSLWEMCKCAQLAGLTAFAVTDHCDVNFWDKTADKNIVDFEMYGSGEYALSSIAEITKLKEQFSNLVCGIELGQPLQNLEKAELISSDPRLDFIIGSHHMNNGENDFYWIKYDKLDSCQIDKLLEDYFLQVLKMCKWGKFDVLGHLTYPLRYICGEYGIDVGISKYDNVIREIFRTLIQNGKGIEINSSGLRQKYGKPFPNFEYIKLYKELGGEILTIGSDAHCTEDIGKGIKECVQLAENAGFEYVSVFKERKVSFIKI